MDLLWSPWRAGHVEAFAGDAKEGGRTLFARLAADDRDEEHGIVWRGEHVFAILNRYPYTNGHLLIVPYREVADYDALTAAEQAELFGALHRAIGWLRASLRPDGFNVGMNLGAAAGAGLPDHLHLHVVPRWSGDTNFMPVVGGAKVIPESLADTYAKLRRAVEANEGADASPGASPGPDAA